MSDAEKAAPESHEAPELTPKEFVSRREGMIYAMDGGLWLHRHVWKGRRMAHLVSTNRDALIRYGTVCGLPVAGLQFKPLKDPRLGIRVNAWHWDLVGRYVPGSQDAD